MFYYRGDGKINYNNFPSNLFETFSNQIVNNTFVFCCSRDTPNANKNNLNYNFTLGCGHPRMWAQYANKYNGVCMAFNKDKLHRAILKTIPNEIFFMDQLNIVILLIKTMEMLLKSHMLKM